MIIFKKLFGAAKLVLSIQQAPQPVQPRHWADPKTKKPTPLLEDNKPEGINSNRHDSVAKTIQCTVSHHTILTVFPHI